MADTASALIEMNNNDVEEAKATAELMQRKSQEKADKAEKHKNDGDTVDEIQRNKEVYKNAQAVADYWSDVVQTLGMIQKADTLAAEEENAKASNESAQQENEAEEPKPIGKGFFGNINDQFRGQVKAAFDFLLKHKSGDLVGVFHRNDIGDIDLVWEDRTKNQGLDHIIDKHIERHNDFANAEEAMAAIEDVINNGTINEKKSRWDKVVLEKDGLMVVVRKNVRDEQGNIINESKNWVVTAFDGNTKQKEKSSSDATLATPNTNEGGRAVTPGEDLSADKGTESSSPAQKPGEKIADAEAHTSSCKCTPTLVYPLRDLRTHVTTPTCRKRRNTRHPRMSPQTCARSGRSTTSATDSVAARARLRADESSTTRKANARFSSPRGSSTTASSATPCWNTTPLT